LILYGRALGLSHSEAEDVLQETFVALLQRGQPPLKPAHYCVRSFRNPRVETIAAACGAGSLGNWNRAVGSNARRAKQPQERVAMRCLAELPVEQREVIVLKLWHEYTFEEIGDLLEISPNTVAGRYRYGLQKLRVCMKGETYERVESMGGAVSFLDTAPPVSGT
jgi:RNA polymerase sigma-70 factor (ECF subfamily)